MLGQFPLAERRMIPFRGGTFEGVGGALQGVSGTIAPGGVDWQYVRSDSVIDLRAHYLLLTDDNEPIEVNSDGIRAAAPEVLARLTAGEPVDPSEYYFRTAIRLHTSAPRLQSLNEMIAVASGERRKSQVVISVHELL
jgi:Protein of unknown function (DUF3237)